jgi:hypothetical protein
MEAGRPRDAAALARTDLSPHFFCQITGDYIRNVSAFDTRESPKQRFWPPSNSPRNATTARGMPRVFEGGRWTLAAKCAILRGFSFGAFCADVRP